MVGKCFFIDASFLMKTENRFGLENILIILSPTSGEREDVKRFLLFDFDSLFVDEVTSEFSFLFMVHFFVWMRRHNYVGNMNYWLKP